MSGFGLLFGRWWGGGKKSAATIPAAMVCQSGLAVALAQPDFAAAGESRLSDLRAAVTVRPEVTRVSEHHFGLRSVTTGSAGLSAGETIAARLASGMRVVWEAVMQGLVEPGGSVGGVIVSGAKQMESAARSLVAVQVRVQSLEKGKPMADARNFDVTWREDGTATVLARLTSRTGSGSATGVKGEGNWVEQADLASIAYQVFDETEENAEVTAGAQSVTIAGAILDTPVTSTALWTADTVGYNFLHDLPPTVFPQGGHIYRVEYKFTFIGGAIGWGVFRGGASGAVFVICVGP